MKTFHFHLYTNGPYVIKCCNTIVILAYSDIILETVVIWEYFEEYLAITTQLQCTLAGKKTSNNKNLPIAG